MLSLSLRRRLPRLILVGLVAIVVGCLVGTKPALAHGPSAEMLEAADAFLADLDEAQRAKATFEFKDQERANWHFIPRERNGLPLKEMTDSQRPLAFALLQSALSNRGLMKSLHIMTLEQILHVMENGAAHRDPAAYYFSIFGTPSSKEAWGWRVEGHHLSLNFTVVGHAIVSTPSFFGTNPAEVTEGPRKGLRVLGREEDLGRKLVHSLTSEQRSTAIISTDAPDDVINGPGRKAQPLEPVGLAATEMNDEQRGVLRQIVEEYIFRLRPQLAEQDLAKIEQAGFSKLHFAWAGSLERGQRHYYRVQGPTFILEYDNTQNDANHAHCVWRNYENDFGEDLLRKHYEESHQK